MSAYVIRRHGEETTCEWCGFPLYVGDRALQAGDWIYCGRTCAAEHRERLELRHDDDACHANGTPID